MGVCSVDEDPQAGEPLGMGAAGAVLDTFATRPAYWLVLRWWRWA